MGDQKKFGKFPNAVEFFSIQHFDICLDATKFSRKCFTLVCKILISESCLEYKSAPTFTSKSFFCTPNFNLIATLTVLKGVAIHPKNHFIKMKVQSFTQQKNKRFVVKHICSNNLRAGCFSVAGK